MRDISPYLLVLFVVAFIAFMVASDSNISTILNSGSTAATAAVGVINGEKITYQEFETRVKEQADMQRQQNPQMEVDDNQIRQSVWDQLVEEILLRQAAEKAGIKVTKDEVLDVMLDSPPEYLTRNFKDSTGNFNRAAYLEVMTNPDIITQNINEGKKRGYIPQSVNPEEEVAKFKSSLLKIEEFLYKSRLTDHFRRAVGAAGSIVSNVFLENKYRNDNSSFDFDYIALDINKVSDKEVGQPTDEELRAEYEKVKQYTKQKPARRMKYISFPLEPSKEDTLAAEKKINRIQKAVQEAATPEQKSAAYQQYYAEYNGKQNEFIQIKTMDPERRQLLENAAVGDIIGPVRLGTGTYIFHVDSLRSGVNEVVKASHILINFGNNKDSAKAFAEGLLKRAKKGEDFAALAREHTQDMGSKEKGGEYDFFPRGRMVKPFEDACFDNPAGSIVGPIETNYGWHIIKVQDKASAEMQYSEILINVQMSQNTKKQLRREAMSFRQQIENGGQNIDSLGKKLRKNVVETMFFERAMPVLGSRAVTEFCFNHDAGAVSEPFELKFYGFVVVQVTGARQAGYKQFEDMKDELKDKVMRRKKMAKLESKAKSLYDQLIKRNADRLFKVTEIDPSIEVRSASQAKNNGFIQGFGNEPAITQLALTAKLNAINGPVAGQRGWFIYQVIRRQDADMGKLAAERQAIMQGLVVNARNAVYSQWFNALKDGADIEDNRSKFFREL
jgi:parvulin-like peptidyl-prolyl isomerase